MSLLDLNLGEVKERELVPAGEQHLEIVDVEFSTSKKGDQMLVLAFRVLDLDGRYYRIKHWLVMESSTDKELDEFRKENTLRFCQAFQIPLDDNSDGSTWIGLDGFAIVKHEEDPEYGIQAKIAKFIPRG